MLPPPSTLALLVFKPTVVGLTTIGKLLLPLATIETLLVQVTVWPLALQTQAPVPPPLPAGTKLTPAGSTSVTVITPLPLALAPSP